MKSKSRVMVPVICGLTATIILIAVVWLRTPATPHVPLPEGLEWFTDGKEYVGYGEKGKPLYYSKDGKTLFEQRTTEYKETPDGHEITFEDTYKRWYDVLIRTKDMVKYGLIHRKLGKMSRPPTFQRLISAPESRIPRFLYRFPDGTYVYVSTDLKMGSKSYHCYRGQLDEMRQVKVVARVSTFSDGGTTFVPTEEGVLCVLATTKEFARWPGPQWRPVSGPLEQDFPLGGKWWENAIRLEDVEWETYDFNEEEGVVRIQIPD